MLAEKRQSRRLNSLLRGKMLFYGKISGGKLKLDNRAELQRYLNNVSRYRENIAEIDIRILRDKCSANQRRYYWGVIIPVLASIEDFRGYTIEEIHETLKMLFLKEKKGELWTIKSTEELNTKEREEYHAKIREWASEILNCYIPKPNEQE
jgi:hypothetical protein